MAKKKKRAPLTKLREAKRFADEYLIAKKLILPAEQSAIARIFNTKGAPTLPGIPAYLPYPWLVNLSRRALYDLALLWAYDNNSEVDKTANLSEFMRYVIKGMEEENSKVKKKMQESIAKTEYDLSLLKKKGATAGIAKFLVDSFAVCIALKAASDVPEYITWFQNWSESLLRQWGEKTRMIDGKDNQS